MNDHVLQATGYQILGVRFDFITFNTVMQTIEKWKRNGESNCVAFVNPHTVMLCCREKQIKLAIARSGLVLPDGVGIILAATLLGYQHLGRVTGPVMMLKLCDQGRKHGYRHYFYGGAENVADRLADRLSTMYPGLKVAGTCCPPFRPMTDKEDLETVRMINAANPDILWVGLGSGKQERWMAAHFGRIHATVMIGVGAAFDFHSGNIGWSPSWIRRLGIEWAYRLAQNPRRMWRRNIDSPLFLLKVIQQRLAMTLKLGS